MKNKKLMSGGILLIVIVLLLVINVFAEDVPVVTTPPATPTVPSTTIPPVTPPIATPPVTSADNSARIQGASGSGERFPDLNSGGRIQGSDGGSFSSFRPQYYSPYINAQGRFETQYGEYWRILQDPAQCGAGQDFLVQVAPFGCSPAVVRSDLLEDQNVPVFCQLDALKLNPLIEVKAIDYITFKETKKNNFISGVGFHPARAALRSNNEELLGSPVLNNIGYVVIVLKRTVSERDMPDKVEGKLTAVIRYDLKNAFGIGKREFYLPELTDQEWNDNYKYYEFWRGKGYLRAENIKTEDGGEARITVYEDKEDDIASVNLNAGESKETPIPGFFCRASMDVRLQGIEALGTTALVRVDDDYFELREGERFLDNNCNVVSLDKSGLTERVTISCRRNSAKILEFSPKVKINYNGQEKDYSLGDRINIINGKSIYFGYLGELKNPTTNQNVPFVILSSYEAQAFGEKLSSDELRRMSSYANNLNSATRVNSALFNDLLGKPFSFYKGLFGGAIDLLQGRNIEIMFLGSTKDFSSDVKQVTFSGFSGPIDKDYSQVDDGTEFETLFNNAMKNYKEIAENFPNEKINDADTETIAEQALWKAQDYAAYAGKYQTRIDLLDMFIEKYPNSKLIPQAKSLKSDVLNSNGGKTSDIITINQQNKVISLEKISKPSCDVSGAIISVKGKDGKIVESCLESKEVMYLTANEFIKLEKIDNSERVQISYFLTTTGVKEAVTQYTDNSQVLTLNNPWGYGGYVITLNKVNSKPVAKVILTPHIDNVKSEVNISYHIGIEKRAIQLTPDKIKERIKYLDAQIEKWNKLSENLGKSVKSLKAACLATGAALTIKNFYSNIGGKSFARTKVMRSSGGWNDRCSVMVAQGKYSSLDACYIENSAQIDKEVNTWYAEIQKQNQEIKNIEKPYSKTSILGEKVIDDDKFMNDYVQNVQADLKAGERLNCELDNTKLNYDEVVNRIELTNWKNNHFSIEDARDMQLYSRILKSSNDQNIQDQARKQLCNELTSVYKKTADDTARAVFAGTLGVPPTAVTFVPEFGASKYNYENLKLSNVNKSYISNIKQQFPNYIKDDSPVAVVQTSSGKKFLVILNDEVGKNQLPIRTTDQSTVSGGATTSLIFDADSGALVDGGTLPIELSGAYFEKYDRSSYENKFLKPELRFYETEPYKGLPGVVPFDCKNGWYAATKQNLPLFGSIKAFDDSGRVSSFYVCNIGKNGREEFDQSLGDDICQLVNLGTGQPYNVFPGLDSSEAKKVIEKASAAVKEASTKYSGKPSSVTINGCTSDVKTQVNTPTIQCQDVMSPTECNIMFNVCDPVICPNSRCDLGGAYRVNDVIQSGIIGSVALCLPNAREKILVPVCLTGIQAGVDGLNSIYKASRDCMQAQLDSGRTVGICDEMQSIYMCDLLWKEAGPISKVAIPKLVEFVTGQRLRGGGEYLSVQDAWNNAEKSVSYMRDYYGANAYKAFKARSTDEVGSEVCKSFVSATYPLNKNFLDVLTEPDSPEQYHAWFSETSYSTATVPATSQYKVFFHIYAGKDIGAYYSVYMKSPPQISGFFENPRIQVASGYIIKGSFADETRDFTAPSGYQELCVSVNGHEECGFQRVTTSFALDYLKDQYLKEQSSQTQITKEGQCISGTTSLYSLVNPNVQAGVEEAISPQLYDHGIIRICATDNPGRGTDPNALDPKVSRWKDVGYCDNDKLRCWIDTQSVASQIGIKTIENETLQKVTDDYVNKVVTQPGYKDKQTISSELSAVNITDVNEANLNERIRQVDSIMESITFNNQRAQAIFIKGQLYELVGRIVYKRITTDIQAKINENFIKQIMQEDLAEMASFHKLNDQQKTHLQNAQSCGDCGKGGGVCEQNECNAISDKLELGGKIGCEFQNINPLIPGGTCSEKAGLTEKQIEQQQQQKQQTEAQVLNSISDSESKKVVQEIATDDQLKAIETAQAQGKEIAKVEGEINPTSDKSGEVVVTYSDGTQVTYGLSGHVIESNTGSSPIFEFNDGTMEGDLFYKYIGTQWQWSDDLNCGTVGSSCWYATTLNLFPKDTSNDNNQPFVSSLTGRTYEQGFAMLIDRTLKNNEGGWFSNTALVVKDSSKEISLNGKTQLVTVEQNSATPLYFKYENKKWRWSPDEENWMDVSTTKVSQGMYAGETVALSNVKLIQRLDSIDKSTISPGLNVFFNENFDSRRTGEPVQDPDTPVKTSLNCRALSGNAELNVELANCITVEKINTLLEGSPAREKGQIFDDWGRSYKIDPIIALAFFQQESTMGTGGVAVKTKSIGNIKFSDTCKSGVAYTREDGARFCVYESWDEGIKDFYRLLNEKYVGTGLDSVEEIIPIYCPEGPKSDCNNAESISTIRNFVLKNREV